MQESETNAHNTTGENRTADVQIEHNINFSKMMLSDKVLLGLTKNGFISPSPIQLRAIPLGRSSLDLLIQAKSGTGKTLVFATIILEAFLPDVSKPQSLVLAPTREIAVQIEQTLTAIGSFTPGFRVGCFIGGLDIADDRKNIQGCQAIVGTPGRIHHLIKNNVLNTDHIGIFVLDEADKLMSSSFLADIKSIWGRLNPKRQVLAASATFEGGLDITLTNFMQNPIGVTPKREVPILLGVKQYAYVMPSNDSTAELSSMQEMFAKVKAIQLIFSMVPFKQCIIFSNSQSRAESYSNYLSQNGWPSNVITGSQDQNVRLKVFKQFKTFQCRILVATDLMARGIDSENVNLVINLDVPSDSVTYLHRIGRCGRFGTQGMAVTLLARDSELSRFQVLLDSLGGSAMSVTKFPHSQNIENMWTYHSLDVTDNIFGSCKAIRKLSVEELKDLKNTIDMRTKLDCCNNEKTSQQVAAKPIETIQPQNKEVSDEKQNSIIERNLNYLKIASLLIDKPKKEQAAEIVKTFEKLGLDENKKFIECTENESFKLELTDPFEEYDTMCVAMPKTETIRTGLSTTNYQQDSISREFSEVNKIEHKQKYLTETLNLQYGSLSTADSQCSVNDESDILQLDDDPFAAYNCIVNETTDNIRCPRSDMLPTNGVGSGLESSINGNDPYESIFQSGIAKKLSSPPTAATKTEVLPTSDTESGSESINEDEPYEFDVSPTSSLQHTPKWQHLQSEATDTSHLNEDIIIEEDSRAPQNIAQFEYKVRPEIPGLNLPSASTTPSNNLLLNLNESRNLVGSTLVATFVEEDPFKAYSMLVDGCSTKSLSSVTTTADIHAEPAEAEPPILPTDSNNLFLDAIARIDFYPNTMTKKTEKPTEVIPFTFNVKGDDKSASNTDILDESVLNSNTAGSNAGSSDERLSIDESDQEDNKIASGLCSYTGSDDEIDEVAEDGTESTSDIVDGEADDEASVCPKIVAPLNAQRKWHKIFMNQVQQIQSFRDYYKLFNRQQFD